MTGSRCLGGKEKDENKTSCFAFVAGCGLFQLSALTETVAQQKQVIRNINLFDIKLLAQKNYPLIIASYDDNIQPNQKLN